MEHMEQLLPIKRRGKEKKELFLESLENSRVSGNVSKALLVSGIRRTTAYRWRKKDKEFAKKWDILVEYADEMLAELVEWKLLQSALRGSVRAIIFWLKNRRPEEWNVQPYCNNCRNGIQLSRTPDDNVLLKRTSLLEKLRK